jgi:sulfite reductase (NADPH) flavoprotein alpha-component
MLAEKKLDQLYALISESSHADLVWMSGYLAGLAAQNIPSAAKPITTPPVAIDTISIIYGTETGNSKKAATMVTTTLKRAGIKTRLIAAENYKPDLLDKESFFLLVISTQGEGEPPATAKPLYDYLHKRVEPFQQLQYGVLALGSKSYPLFCQAGIDVDAQLKRLKATPAIAMGTCEEDFETDAEVWIQQLLQHLQNPLVSAQVTTVVKRPAEGKKVFKGTLGSNIKLSDRGSNKKVHHLEFDLGEDIVYTPGNAVGIIPENNLIQVAKILGLLNIAAEQPVMHKEQSINMEDVLAKKVTISNLPVNTVKKYAQWLGIEIPETRMDLFDLLRIYPLPDNNQVQELIEILPGITPRLYTISSSPAAHPCQLHLTAQVHYFNLNGEEIPGLGSSFLTSLRPGAELEMFLHSQKSFQLPPDEKDVIMIAQGTGIAPFRSFLAERDTNGATGKNWLFFGEENRVSDFYYQSEIQKYVDIGTLHQVNPVFIKNTSNPNTLAQKINEQAANIWKWIQKGAYVFISGEKEPTGKEVEAALLQLIADQQAVSPQEATAYLKQMQKEGRFAKELY